MWYTNRGTEDWEKCLEVAEMKNEDVKIGQHCWAIMDNELLVVLKIKEKNYVVCGDWECEVIAHELELIEIINIPQKHEDKKLYYVD